MSVFQYNGFQVRAIGPVQSVSGGYVRRVEIINPPAYVFDTRFDAVVDSSGSPLKK